MNCNVYKFAEHTFKITSKYGLFVKYSTPFLANQDEEAEFEIEVSTEDIEYERLACEKEEKKEGVVLVSTAPEMLETCSIYRKIARYLIKYDIIAYHGSTLRYKNYAYMFIARSGTGKSTHSSLWRELLKDEVTMINDDKPLIKITEKESIAYGNAWAGKAHLGDNISAPIKAIGIVTRGLTNSCTQITLAEAFPMLVQQAYRDADPNMVAKTISLVTMMGNNVKLYKLIVNMDIEAAKVAVEAMTKED